MKNKTELEPNGIVIALIISGILNGFLLNKLLDGWKLWVSMIVFILVIYVTLTKTREKQND